MRRTKPLGAGAPGLDPPEATQKNETPAGGPGLRANGIADALDFASRPAKAHAQPGSRPARRARPFETDNPRHLRALAALLRHPVTREALDALSGASNSPDLVHALRRRGLDLPCVRVACVDRDGRPCRAGVYALSARDRRRVATWLRQRKASAFRVAAAGSSRPREG